ncbi:hypothetical protein PG996_004394 [Apiospora saccharicola]|uniref:Uncharacterized protein n=1 Tax=Apiospora saccharicola TaxID=335842 RepID=A0ABR1W413_9PEZI
MHRIKAELEGLGPVPQPMSHRSPDSTLFGTRTRHLVSGTYFRWSTPQTQIFQAFIVDKYPNHKACDLGPLLKALDLDGYEDMLTENGESVYRLIVEKVRRKLSNTEKPMKSDGLSTQSAPAPVVSFKETLPPVDYQVTASQAARKGGRSAYDLPSAPTLPIVEPVNTAEFRLNPFSEYYRNDGHQSLNAVPGWLGGGYRHPRSQQEPSPRAYEPRERSAVTMYSGADSMATPSTRERGEVTTAGVRSAKSARRGHIERMAETLFFFSEELKEAQDEQDEDEEFLSQVDSMKRVLDKLSQKMENLKLLAPAEE